MLLFYSPIIYALSRWRIRPYVSSRVETLILFAHFAISRFHFISHWRSRLALRSRAQLTFNNISTYIRQHKRFFIKDYRARWLFHNFLKIEHFLCVAFQEFWSEMFEMLSRNSSLGLGETRTRAGLPSSVFCLRPMRPTTINRWTVRFVRR